MTTQRDRLAAVLFGIRWGDDHNEVLTELSKESTEDNPLDYEEEWSMTPLAFADALIARGVRVSDFCSLSCGCGGLVRFYSCNTDEDEDCDRCASY